MTSPGSAGRVIAGSARGVRLAGAGEETRPLGDRVKQTLFAILEPAVRGRGFLDLFAGTGAGGIEALSRGAARAVFVERDPAAIRVIGANLAATHLANSATVVRADALTLLSGPDAARLGSFAAVLVDPPYDRPDLLRAALELLGGTSSGLLDPVGLVVAKHFWRESLPARIGLLASSRQRRFGETMLTFYRPARPDDERSGEEGDG
jgi:16S rRNA (guanine(966)-N(2))-methyltransferase RsmD